MADERDDERAAVARLREELFWRSRAQLWGIAPGDWRALAIKTAQIYMPNYERQVQRHRGVRLVRGDWQLPSSVVNTIKRMLQNKRPLNEACRYVWINELKGDPKDKNGTETVRRLYRRQFG